MTSSAPPKTSVLYLDHCGHPAPLTLCYHATSSRVLSSCIDDRGSPSTITEVDSAYCPSCLSFYDATTASSTEMRGYCPKATCKTCPACNANLAVKMGNENDDTSGDDKICYYLCGHCRWTSQSCGVTSPAPTSSDPSKEELKAATDALGSSYRQRLASVTKTSPATTAYDSLVGGWAVRTKDAERKRREGEVVVGGRRSTLAGAGSRRRMPVGDGPGGWSVESLEKKIMQRKEEQLANVVAPLVKGIDIQRLTVQDGMGDSAGHEPMDESRLTPQQLCGQAVLCPGSAAAALKADTVLDLLPLSVALRPRKSRRCRAELAAGRTGILVKPKLNPLEGDSSLRSGHGQWFKKDSSAIHVVPRVRIVRHGQIALSDGKRIRHAMLLSVSNPTLGMIRLRINGANLQDVGASGLESGHTLQNIRVDILGRTRANVRIIGNSSTLVLPDMVELEAVEDAFLDLGSGKSQDPDQVKAWDAAAVLKEMGEEPIDGPTYCPFRTVAISKDRVWIQLLVDEEKVEKRATEEFLAVPATLQVEIGNGSWESSLIKSADVKEGETDLVSLSLLLAFQAK